MAIAPAGGAGRTLLRLSALALHSIEAVILMAEKVNGRRQRDWQKSDARVLGQILAAQNIGSVLPDTTRIAEFYAQALISVPGLAACRVCLGGRSAQAGEMESSPCAECETLRNTTEKSETPDPANSEFKCNLAEQPDIRLAAIDSYQRKFGFFVFKVDNAAVFDIYQPFISNLANHVALFLENRLQKDLLQKAHDELERKVDERTRDLKVANDMLQRELDVNKAISEMSRTLISEATSIGEVADTTLHYARALTGSEHGFVSFIDPRTGDAVGYTLTAMMDKECQIEGEDRRIVFPIGPDGRYPGLWGHALNTRQDFYTNSPATHVASTGTPSGHVPLENFLAVPALVGDRLVGEVALANAPRDYTDADLKVVARLSNLYAMAAARAEAESAIRDSEERWSSLLQAVEVGVVIHDPATRIVASNAAAQEVLGLTESQMLGKTAVDPRWCFVGEDGAVMPLEAYPVSQVVSSGQSIRNLVVGIVRPDRPKPTWALVNADPVYQSDGTLREVIVAFMDITERKQAEETLRSSEEHFRTVVENSPIIVFSIDRNGEFTLSEGKGLAKLGLASGEMVGKSAFEVYAHNPAVIRNVKRALAGEEFTAIDEEAGLSYETRWTHIRGDDGEANKVVGVSVDVTERKRADEAIRKLNQELEGRVADRTAKLEAANRELEAFSYSVSHDLRAPLRHINGFVELLQERTARTLDPQSQHYMARISDSSERMGVLIDDLLSFSRAGRQDLCKVRCDLGVLVQEAVRELEPEAEDRNIDWRIEDLPVVTGDPVVLHLVLVNLCSNALKFTQPRQQAEIEIGCMPSDGTEVVVFVRDNGVGFDPKYAGKLFRVFERLHRAEEFPGTGIGLANVRRIINRHGGRTWAEGAVNRGATFFFSLPL